MEFKGKCEHRFQGKPLRFSCVKLETLQEKKTNLLIHLKEVACKDHVQHGYSVSVQETKKKVNRSIEKGNPRKVSERTSNEQTVEKTSGQRNIVKTEAFVCSV